MGQAILWGTLSGSAVLIGAIIAMFTSLKKEIIGIIMSFGTGLLMGAATYELLENSVEDAGFQPVAIGFIAGAVVFTVANYFLHRRGASHRKRSQHDHSNSSGLAIFLGTIMDAIPESIMIGASIAVDPHVSWVLVVAIFLSNIPEGLSSTEGMKKSDYSKGKIWGLWIAVVIITAISAWSGFFFLEDASPFVMSLIASFAGGGIVAMVASTMMPEAYEEGGPIVGLLTAIGLFLSLLLTTFS